MAIRWAFTALFLILSTIVQAKPPALGPRDAKAKIEEILRSHASHHALTPDIIKRSLQNYLDELDPVKTYLTENEILTWTAPSEELINKTLTQIQGEDFTPFEEIHQVFINAIARRADLESTIEGLPPPEDVCAEEFKNCSWPKSEDELIARLLRIKALQMKAADKLPQDTKSQFVQRMQKRRLHREKELQGTSPTEKQQIILATALKAISSSLDSQTCYFTPSEANQFLIQVQQRLFGIGAQLRDDLDGLTVIRIIEGGPASIDKKLQVNDKIIAVNKEPIVGMDIGESVELIRGIQGSHVSLTIIRKELENNSTKEQTLDIDIIRGEVVVKEMRIESSSIPYGDGVIALIHLYSFYQDQNTSSAQDITNAIKKISSSEKLQGIILDLRHNAGGLLDQAVLTTSLFIDKGVVVSVKDNTGKIKRLRNVESNKIWDGPLIVLTNRASASASEIVAQTLQDYGRALIVGDDHTFGKGTFQSFTLEATHFGKVNPKGEYKVTRGRYYTVSGKSPQLTGVSADIVVPGELSAAEIGEKFLKYPLETDTIAESFEDDFIDLSPLYRAKIARLYGKNTQKKLSAYNDFKEMLVSNSEKRISSSKNYQNFLKSIASTNFGYDDKEEFGQDDVQQEEAINIMKDLLYMSHDHLFSHAGAA